MNVLFEYTPRTVLLGAPFPETKALVGRPLRGGNALGRPTGPGTDAVGVSKTRGGAHTGQDPPVRPSTRAVTPHP